MEFDMSQVVTFILEQVTTVVALAILLVWLNNKVKELIPDSYKKLMFLVSLSLWVALMFLLRVAFEIEISNRLTVFYGIMVWLTASGLYDAGLWQKTKVVEEEVNLIDELITDPDPIGNDA